MYDIHVDNVKLKKLYPNVEIPQYATEGDVGFDLVAHNFKDMYVSMINGEYHPTSMQNKSQVQLPPHARILVGCGFSIELPKGTQLEIRGRSGNALRRGVVVCHGVGTIDNSYRGEIGVLVLNTSDYPVDIKVGDKVGQGVLMPYLLVSFTEVDKLSETDRGVNGFGSTDTLKSKHRESFKLEHNQTKSSKLEHDQTKARSIDMSNSNNRAHSIDMSSSNNSIPREIEDKIEAQYPYTDICVYKGRIFEARDGYAFEVREAARYGYKLSLKTITFLQENNTILHDKLQDMISQNIELSRKMRQFKLSKP